MKDIYWIGDTRETLSDFPKEVKSEIGFALYCEQAKIPHPSIKPLRGFEKAVREIRASHRGDAYRVAYVVNLGNSLYVLHVFQKKSKRGIATPKSDMDLIRKRLKLAVEKAGEKGK